VFGFRAETAYQRADIGHFRAETPSFGGRSTIH
jgi:hypothetical protein